MDETGQSKSMESTLLVCAVPRAETTSRLRLFHPPQRPRYLRFITDGLITQLVCEPAGVHCSFEDWQRCDFHVQHLGIHPAVRAIIRGIGTGNTTQKWQIVGLPVSLTTRWEAKIAMTGLQASQWT